MGKAVESISYTLPGRPVTWQRTYNVRTRRTADRKQLDRVNAAKRGHALMFAKVRAGAPWALDGAFAIEVVGYWPDAKTGDSDRLPGCAMDALQGYAYKADRQVRDQTGRVRVDRANPRTVVTVTRLGVDPVQPLVTITRLDSVRK